MPKSVEDARSFIQAVWGPEIPNDVGALHDALQDLIDAVRYDSVIRLRVLAEMNSDLSVDDLAEMLADEVPSE